MFGFGKKAKYSRDEDFRQSEQAAYLKDQEYWDNYGAHRKYIDMVGRDARTLKDNMGIMGEPFEPPISTKRPPAPDPHDIPGSSPGQKPRQMDLERLREWLIEQSRFKTRIPGLGFQQGGEVKDKFGYGTYQEGGEVQNVRNKADAKKDLLHIFKDKKFRGELEGWLDADPHESDYASYRMILKKLFPGSGLIKGENKKGEATRQIATYAGPDTKEGQKEFEMYRTVMHMLADAKGLKYPDAIALSTELAKIYGNK